MILVEDHFEPVRESKSFKVHGELRRCDSGEKQCWESDNGQSPRSNQEQSPDSGTKQVGKRNTENGANRGNRQGRKKQEAKFGYFHRLFRRNSNRSLSFSAGMSNLSFPKI